MDLKIKSHAALAKTLARLRSKGKKIVFTNGCFDILHVGHIKYLETAKKAGGGFLGGAFIKPPLS